MERGLVIFQAGIEGGTLTLYGSHNGKGWVFSADIHDQTPELIGESEQYSRWKEAYSWQEALALLDHYKWHSFFPLLVHPIFRGPVLSAVLTRTNVDDEKGFENYNLRSWLDICGEVPDVQWKLVL